MKEWIKAHPDLWQFILFNILSNCATVTNFIVMWVCTSFLFTAWADVPFSFFIFHYTNVESDFGLCGFLSFLVATAAAQTVNFFVQKNLVFKSNAQFGEAVPKYALLAVVLVILSAAMPAYSQSFFVGLGVAPGIAPTLATVVNVLLQIIISYPAMKFWIMPDS